jgi:pantoate--beta-alanine ligase
MSSTARMRVIRDPRAVRRQIRRWRTRGETVAFVPTMGAFHRGHLSLMQRARRVADRVVVSIFVNPAQFGPREDFAAYPRNPRRDLSLARREEVDLCFLPDTAALYPEGLTTEVHVAGLEHRLEGRTRPTHFAGVALVITKLLHITEPDVLLLGQKDAQQAVILETLVRDLDLPVRVIRGPVVREPDGLAMSSRNIHLDVRQRQAAPVLWRALSAARAAARNGERSAARIKAIVRREIRKERQLRLEYVALVDARTLEDLKTLRGRVLIPLAARLGRTRLIDNVEFQVDGGRS